MARPAASGWERDGWFEEFMVRSVEWFSENAVSLVQDADLADAGQGDRAGSGDGDLVQSGDGLPIAAGDGGGVGDSGVVQFAVEGDREAAVDGVALTGGVAGMELVQEGIGGMGGAQVDAPDAGPPGADATDDRQVEPVEIVSSGPVAQADQLAAAPHHALEVRDPAGISDEHDGGGRILVLGIGALLHDDDVLEEAHPAAGIDMEEDPEGGGIGGGLEGAGIDCLRLADLGEHDLTDPQAGGVVIGGRGCRPHRRDAEIVAEAPVRLVHAAQRSNPLREAAAELPLPSSNVQ